MDKRANARQQNKESSRISSKKPAVDLSQASVTNEERYQLIARAAYLRAEQRGFSPGSELDDWLAAESEIDRILAHRSGDPVKSL